VIHARVTLRQHETQRGRLRRVEADAVGKALRAIEAPSGLFKVQAQHSPPAADVAKNHAVPKSAELDATEKS